MWGMDGWGEGMMGMGGGGGGMMGGFGGGPPQRPGDWNCPSCGDLQFARNAVCRKCGTPNPMGGGGADMWGSGGAMYGWGPWASGKGKGGGGPYGKGGKGGGGGGAPKEYPPEKPKGPTPEIVMMNLDPSSALVTNGFPPEGPGIVYDKSYDIFSESDHILWDFMPPDCGDLKQVVEFHHDPDCTSFPEIYNAWKAAGQEDNLPIVATCASKAVWGVGFGGKVNAMRAAKLAMALQLAKEAEPHVLAQAISNHASFGKFCKAGGVAC